MTLTRDSMVWWVAAGGALLAYLAVAQKPPTEWTYTEWIHAGIAGVGWLAGKLGSSPLPLSYAAQSKMNAGESYRDIPAPPAQTPPPPPTKPTE